MLWCLHTHNQTQKWHKSKCKLLVPFCRLPAPQTIKLFVSIGRFDCFWIWKDRNLPSKHASCSVRYGLLLVRCDCGSDMHVVFEHDWRQPKDSRVRRDETIQKTSTCDNQLPMITMHYLYYVQPLHSFRGEHKSCNPFSHAFYFIFVTIYLRTPLLEEREI